MLPPANDTPTVTVPATATTEPRPSQSQAPDSSLPQPVFTAPPPTPTPTPQPTATTPPPTPTPTPRSCSIWNNVVSNPIYQGDGYAFSNGGSYRAASGYCNGRAHFIFTQAPPVADTEVRLCLSSGSCGGWVQFVSVGSKLLIARGMTEGTTFHLQFQGHSATGSYTVYGQLYY